LKPVAFCLAVVVICLSLTGCNPNDPQIALESLTATLGFSESKTPMPGVSEISVGVTTTSTPAVTFTRAPEPTFTQTLSPTFTTTPTLSPFDAIQCEEDWCSYPGHFWLSRPIENDPVEPTYRYGSTEGGKREEHHGIELIDDAGTPVMAAADGIVIVAGNDLITKYSLYKDFYGNLVIIQHDLPQTDDTIFTLYGHLTYVNVEVGETVERGQIIGTVGSTGAATGSHLHFEVRVDENAYNSTSNPELWLEPGVDSFTGELTGTLAIRLLDPNGPINSFPVVIDHFQAKDGPIIGTFYAETYAWSTPNNDLWKEQAVIGDLAPGLYRVSFTRGVEFKFEYVSVFPGEVSLVEINIH
jgi:hypothetical protein